MPTAYHVKLTPKRTSPPYYTITIIQCTCSIILTVKKESNPNHSIDMPSHVISISKDLMRKTLITQLLHNAIT